MSSDEYAGLIRKYQIALDNINSCISKFVTGSDSISTVRNYFSEILIDNGLTLGENELGNLSTSINNCISNLNSMAGECGNKISEYEEKYREALIREEQEKNKNLNY